MLGSMIDWTQVLTRGVPDTIAAVGGATAAIYAARNHRKLRTPSGQSVGVLAERANHLAEVSAVRAARIDKAVNGDTVPDEGQADG